MTVALFLFWDCSGRLKPWNLRDIHALDVQLLNTNTWSKSVSENMADLDIIMKKELRYYLDNDLRIYERLDPHYESMKTSISEVDSIAKELEAILSSIKKYDGVILTGSTLRLNEDIKEVNIVSINFFKLRTMILITN